MKTYFFRNTGSQNLSLERQKNGTRYVGFKLYLRYLLIELQINTNSYSTLHVITCEAEDGNFGFRSTHGSEKV